MPRGRALLAAIVWGLLAATAQLTARAADSGLTVLRYRPPEGPNDERFRYFVGMLDLAMRKTRAEFGDYRLEPAAIPISQDRAFDLVRRGRYVNIVWGMTSKSRESETLPIRIPLLKGLLGYRVLLVRPDRAKEFDTIRNLHALARFTCVQGPGWPDTGILRANGLPVVTSTDYDGMFEMLLRGRVDYFPRSVAEAWTEQARFSTHSLQISKSPLLVYRGPIYFFVNRKDTAIAQRLRLGLERAIADGSFDRQFMKREEIRWAVAFLNSGHYRVFRLRNPTLPAATPLDDAKLWLHIPWIDAVFETRQTGTATPPAGPPQSQGQPAPDSGRGHSG